MKEKLIWKEQVRTRAVRLTREDWIEIFYAVLSRRDAVGRSPETGEGDWPGHLGRILDKIGPDGKIAASAGVSPAK